MVSIRQRHIQVYSCSLRFVRTARSLMSTCPCTWTTLASTSAQRGYVTLLTLKQHSHGPTMILFIATETDRRILTHQSCIQLLVLKMVQSAEDHSGSMSSIRTCLWLRIVASLSLEISSKESFSTFRCKTNWRTLSRPHVAHKDLQIWNKRLLNSRERSGRGASATRSNAGTRKWCSSASQFSVSHSCNHQVR